MLKKFILVLLIFLLSSSLVAYTTHAEKMPLEEKLGQMLCLDFRPWNKEERHQTEELGIVTTNDGSTQAAVTEINDEIKEIITKYNIDSIILFAENFKNKEQSKKLICDLQQTAKDSGNLPLIIAVD